VPGALEIMSYLEHISTIKAFDFLNVSNLGMKNGKMKFFDIT